MQQDLADSLGVTVASIRLLDPGYYPAQDAWITPEWTPDGRLCCLIKRLPNGKKIAWDGGHRGLAGLHSDFPNITPSYLDLRFERVGDLDIPCPVCGRERDGCLTSMDSAGNPVDTICVRTPQGAAREMPSGCGWLHHIRESQGTSASSAGLDSIVLVVEGWSDLLMAKDLGYRAVAAPSAQCGAEMLAKLLRGQYVDAVLVGDNDEVGRAGLETKFETLKLVCRSAVKVFPPVPYKDLRAAHPTREQFEEWISKTGNRTSDSNLLPCSDPPEIADLWLREQMTNGNGDCLFIRVNGTFYHWQDTYYHRMEEGAYRGLLYEYLGPKKVKTALVDDAVKIQKLKLNKHVVDDVVDVLESKCLVSVDPGEHEPLVIATGRSMDLTRAVVFKNGIYYPLEDRLAELTPGVFLTSTLPYAYNPEYVCPDSLGVIYDIFQDDQESINLLQEFAGYLLTADNSFESLLFLIGAPGAGKGTIVTMFESMLGPQRCGTFELSDLNNKFARARLLGKYIVCFNEDVVGRRDSGKTLAALKRLSGNDSVSVEEKFKQGFDTKLFCRAIYSGNELPIFEDASRSLARRLNILKFSHVPDKPDYSLKRRVVGESAGLAVWALEGLRRLLKNQKFTRPKASEEFLQDSDKLSNPLGATFEDCLNFDDPAGFTPKVRLYQTYCAICEIENMPRLANNIFFQKFKARYGAQVVDMNRYGPVDRATGRRSWGVQGVILTPAAQEDYSQGVTYGIHS
jgi:putative DNA primase/helicase